MKPSEITEGFFWITNGPRSGPMFVEKVDNGLIAHVIEEDEHRRMIVDEYCAAWIDTLTPIPDKSPGRQADKPPTLALAQQILEIVRGAGGKITRAKLLKKSKIKVRELDEILDMLRKREEVAQTKTSGTIIYTLRKS